MTTENPVGLKGIDFIEFSTKDPEWMGDLFKAFGFSKVAKHNSLDAYLYQQSQIKIIINHTENSFSREFEKKHGPCVSAMGWKVSNSQEALKTSIARGAEAAERQDYLLDNGEKVPAILGIGDSLIYFTDDNKTDNTLSKYGFIKLDKPEVVEPKGFEFIDHLTNNVEQGGMETWSNFYKSIFGFTEIKYFDIRGAKTGLLSYALQSPCQSFCIPINEGTEEKSQINEYLREYKGAGVQHIAFSTNNILKSLDLMENTGIETLDIDDEYYAEVYDRVPGVTEDREHIRRHNVLIDGDKEGYLLQIFTKNIIGPIFIEIIQRKNHYSFGEGNFGALFRSIERDQMKRGYLK